MIIEYFKKVPCVLCNKLHEPKVHSFVFRKTPFDKHKLLVNYVVRLICYDNKSSKDKKQYTITVLPSFIQPYSRFLTSTILSSINKYFTGKIKNILSATYDMGIENEKTFLRYLNRVKNRMSKWNLYIYENLLNLNKSTEWKRVPVLKKSFNFSWYDFKKLLNIYCNEISKISNSKDLILYGMNQFEYFFGILSRNNFGLGP